VVPDLGAVLEILHRRGGLMRRYWRPSFRGADGSRECAPDDRLRDEAIHPRFVAVDCFAALAMTQNSYT
jgi:hypothetical protein